MILNDLSVLKSHPIDSLFHFVVKSHPGHSQCKEKMEIVVDPTDDPAIKKLKRIKQKKLLDII